MKLKESDDLSLMMTGNMPDFIDKINVIQKQYFINQSILKQ